MLGLVFALVSVAAGLILTFTRRKRLFYIALGCFALGLIVGISSCITTVDTGHTGVVTVFGKVQNQNLDSGLHFKAPWQTVVQLDNRVQKATQNLSCFSSDIQEVEVVYTLNYQISKKNAQEIYREVGISYYQTVIMPNVAEAVKVVTAKYTAEQLIGSRSELAEAIESSLTEQLARYNIEVVSTAIEDMDFTDAFTNAVESKQVAAQNKLQAEIEQAQKTMEKQAEAERSVIDANAAAEVAAIQAQAEAEVTKIKADAEKYAGERDAEKNRALAASMTKDLLKYYYIQQWDGKLPDTYAGDSASLFMGLN